MVTYRRWISLLFEVHGDSADATVIMREGGAEWTRRKQALQDASVAEARQHAKSL